MAKNQKPAGLLSVEQRMKDDISRYSIKGNDMWAKDLQETRDRLNKMRRRWAKLKEHPTVQRMVAVAERKLKAWQADFYDIDLEHLEKQGYLERPFIWIVREHGTHLYPLEGKPLEIESAKAGLNCHVSRIQKDSLTLDPDQECYIIDPRNGMFRKVTKLSQVPFKVLEPNAVEVRQEGQNQWRIYKSGRDVAVVSKVYEQFQMFFAPYYDFRNMKRVQSVEVAVKMFEEPSVTA